MVDVTQATESSYLTVDLVRASPTKKCVIIDAGEYVEAEFKGKKYAKFQMNVQIDGKIKTWSPNKDTNKNLAEEYTFDSQNWIGKVVKLSIRKINGKDSVDGMPLPDPKVIKESF